MAAIGVRSVCASEYSMNTNRDIIKSLYRQFRRKSASLDDRHLDLLCDNIVDQNGLELDDDSIVFTSMPDNAPLKRIRLDNINGVAEFGPSVAIVLHSSIIFFNRLTHETTVNLRL